MTEDDASHLRQVAEAALLALGPQLEWDDYFEDDLLAGSQAEFLGGRYGISVFVHPADRRICYQVSSLKDGEKWQHHQREYEVDEVPAAKAACERHHATGKWG